MRNFLAGWLSFPPRTCLLLLSVVSCAISQAAPVNWSQEAVVHSDLSQTADSSNVSTSGTLVAAVKAGGAAATVNGVTFAAGSGNLNFSHSSWSAGGGWGSNAGGFYTTDASTLSNGANTWLNSAKYFSSSQSNSSATLNLLGLTPGHKYLVQLFFADLRSVYPVDGRTVSVDGGMTKYRYAFCPAGGPYGYLVLNGTFIADAASQGISMNCYAQGGAIVGPQINAYQFRDVTSVTGPPVIATQPQSQNLDFGSPVNFNVSATGIPPFTYQWHHDNAPIEGATHSMLSLTNIRESDAGSYHVLVTDANGSTASQTATLNVVPPPEPIDTLDPAVALDAYNTLWTSPSQNDRGAMPLGNGEVGIMLWAEANGDLQFYIARTDSRTELDRLVKLGKVRLRLSPNPFATGQPFRQLLNLHDGRAEITAGSPSNQVTLKVFIDSDSPTIHVAGESTSPVQATAIYETWRTQQYTGNVGSSPLAGSSSPSYYESADVVDVGEGDKLVFYHRNAWSCVAKCAEVQSMSAYLSSIPETLANRTFGGVMTLTGASVSGANSLVTTTPVSTFDLKITTHTAQTPTLSDWVNQTKGLAQLAPVADEAQQRTAQWWNDYWSRSWLFIQGDNVSVQPMGANAKPLQIGADSSGGSKFTGSMARCSVYNRALTAGEVASLAQGAPDSNAAIASGLIESWGLGSTVGGVCVGRMGTGLNLSVQGGSVTTSTTGSISQAKFSGGYFAGTDDARYEPTAGLSQEAWINLSAGDANNGRLFDKITANQTDGYLLDLYPGRALRFYNGSDSVTTAGNTLATGTWVHVAVTYDNQTKAKALYVNGVLVSQGAAATETEATPSAVTRAYVLGKWMSACGARGNFPAMFNGSLWTVMPNTNAISISNNPDYRNWDHAYFYQNTRLLYHSMPARGETDFMQPLFNYYRSFWELNRKRAIEWHGAEGQFNNEMTTSFGLLPCSIYGYNRSGVPKWYTANQYGGAVTISPGLELLAMMLDRYDHTGDNVFLQDEIVPYAQDLFRFIETRYPTRNNGKIVIASTHAVETYWNTTNPTTVVSGMHCVLDRLLAMPGDLLTSTQRTNFSALKALTPAVPTQQVNSKTVFAPADSFGSRQNVEVPELYPIFPYRVCGLGRSNLQRGVDSFEEIAINRNYFKPFTLGGPLYVESFSGWQQLPMEAAMLGLTDYAKTALTQNCQLFNTGYRFRGMWGPIYDSVPDGDHGSNILNTAQLMVFQTVGDKILLLPAWPKEWNVSFKFHAPKNTTVSGRYRNGVLENLEVNPAFRKKDVVLMADVPVTATSSASIRSYDTWRLAQFQALDLEDSTQWDPNADPDHDTLCNCMEYAIGTDPLVPNASPGELITVGNDRVVRFEKGSLAAIDPNVDYQIERSSDLNTWGLITPTENGEDVISYTFPEDDSRAFIRLKVTTAGE